MSAEPTLLVGLLLREITLLAVNGNPGTTVTPAHLRRNPLLLGQPPHQSARLAKPGSTVPF